MQEEKEFVSDLIEQGVPTAEVMENVEAYLKKEGNIGIEEGIRRLEAIYRKYKQVEQQLTEQKSRLVSKLPDLEKSVRVINHLEEKSKKKEIVEVTHLLSEHVYQRVKTDSPDKVLLWLGSNVMVEFSLNEARCILEDNYKTKDGVTKYEKELAFLKDQITTTEVNMAHVYNYGIRQRADR
ncbi:Prefoldin subunit family protein [Brugia malayi]|uniref:Prefoldin subunit 3 n=1 Tax=Brugia malayi TaxID=6279 RepID=A0A4E9FP64_BRUMA|nr:Prefoldin subunit family protein [Brugia malayi]VIO97408.1 Prefoldin subunit family protein [Brugia malayi]